MTEEKPSLFDLNIEPETSEALRDGAKWARLLAILLFIGMGLVILALVYTYMKFSAYSSAFGSSLGIIFFIYFVAIAINFIPTLFLFRFGGRTLSAIDTTDQDSLNNGISNLKSYFKFLGIMLIVGYGLVAVSIIFQILNAISH